MSKRKNVLYYDLSNGYFVDVIENQNNNRLDFFVYSSDFPELKVQYPGPDGNLRQNFKTLESIIKDKSKDMIKEYHKEPYIRNRCNKSLPVIIDENKVKPKKLFNNIFFEELKGGYSVEVEELQDFKKGTMIRNYFICDNTQSYKYIVHRAEGELASFTPIDELIAKNCKQWIDEENKTIIDAICNELTNIDSYIDEVKINNYRFKMFKYKDGTFCIHSNDGDTDMFYKFNNISDAYMDFYKKMEEQYAEIFTKNTETHIRKRINNCRKYIAEKNDMLFVSEMSIIKGLLYSYNKNNINLEKIIPEELYINSFISRYENLTNDKFLDLNF